MADLAVVILTYNEEVHIERALRSVGGIARDLVVVDSGSSDRTVEIARERGARVLTHPFVNQAQQFQWALDNAALASAWIMRLDADEVIEPDLADEIERKLPTLSADVTGVNLKRKHVFMGRWIRHGGRYPVVLTRIWRTGAGRIEDRWMDEHVVLSGGRTVTFDGGFADINLHDLSHFIDKHNRYATREAMEVVIQKYGLLPRSVDQHLASQARLKRNIKDSVYNKTPFAIGAAGYFTYRFFLRAGFLDGPQGVIYHGLQGGWYRFLVGAKVMELDRALARLEGRDARLEALARLTGYDLGAIAAAPEAAGADG